MKITLLRSAKPGGLLRQYKEGSRSQRCSAGNLLMVTLIVMGVIGVLVIGCLSVARTQNVAVTRSQSWNACIPLIEAGVEEAFAHLNNHVDTNITSDGWSLVNGFYSQTRTIGNDYYTVGILITNPLRPMIICTGYVALAAGASGATPTAFAAAGVPSASAGQTQYLARAVRVLAAKKPYYPKALVAREGIDMKGNKITIDSFDSSDPAYSTATNPGGYDPAKDKDNGDVGTVSGLTDSIGIGNANIKGHVRTGPGGSASVGPNGAAGSLAWNNAGNSGIQPGWFSDDMNVTFPPVDPPFSGGAPAPVGGTFGGVAQTYVIGDGNYQLDKIKMSGGNHMVVTGKVVLYVVGDVSLSGNAEIDIIPPNGSLNLYVGGANADFGGNGIKNPLAGNFYYWGLPNNVAVSAKGNVIGAVYAPNAALTMNGNGYFIGSAVVRSVKLNGNYDFHYDEALNKNGPLENFIVTSWVEL